MPNAFAELGTLSNPNPAIRIFVTTEVDASKADGEYVANVLEDLKARDANRLQDRFGAKVGHGTLPLNNAKSPICLWNS